MARVIWSVMTTLDGYYEGPGTGWERIAWCRADEEWQAYSLELLQGATALLFGRLTFDGMAGYWPQQSDPVAERMNTLEKVVFSATLESTSWNGARISRDPVAEVTSMRVNAAGDLVLLASGELADTLVAHGLIDEFRLAVNPVILGAGTRAFRSPRPTLLLERAVPRLFSSGIIELRYRLPADPPDTNGRTASR
jgi:dihydrofolate reductase